MAEFSYRVITKDNRVRHGTVRAFLKRVAVKEATKDGSSLLAISKVKKPFIKEVPFRSQFSTLTKITFLRNLSAMLATGMPVTRALEVLASQARTRTAREMIASIKDDVRNGKRFPEALAKFPKYFPEYLTEMIAVGDMTGMLSETLEEIAGNLERDYEITRKVVGALIYPAILIAAIIIVGIIIITLVLPAIINLFNEFHASLPLPTRIMVAIGTFMQAYHWVLLFAVIAAAAALTIALRTTRGRYMFHSLILRLPVFGELAKEFNLARFFRAVGSLFRSGLSLVRSTDIAKKTLKNVVYRDAITSTQPLLLHGVQLSETIGHFPDLFPAQLLSMVEVGEQTGKFDSVFRHVVGYYERSINHKIQILNTLIEPVLIVMVGIVVGGLALSIFMPLYSITQAIH